MKDKLSKLAMLYTLPLLCMILVSFAKTIQIQNEPLGLFGLMVVGFILVVIATVALLRGEI